MNSNPLSRWEGGFFLTKAAVADPRPRKLKPLFPLGRAVFCAKLDWEWMAVVRQRAEEWVSGQKYPYPRICGAS
jgi:hypothetical protein